METAAAGPSPGRRPVGGGYYALTCPLGFQPRLWQRHAGLRDRMLDDLLAERLSTGMNRDEVRALLGEGGSPRQYSVLYQDRAHQIMEEYYYLCDSGPFAPIF